VGVTKDPRTINIDAFRPGNAFVHASNVNFTSVNTVAIEVRAPKLNGFPGQQTGTLTQTKPNSNLISADGNDSSVPGAITGGRPVNPKNIPGRRKINLGGEGETPGFEDYQSDLNFCAFSNNQTGGFFFFRPWTEDPDPAVFVKDGEAGDICIRGIPLDRSPTNINVIKRIAGPGCRLTFDGGQSSLAVLKKEFPEPRFKHVEKFDAAGQIVIEFP